MVNKRARGQQFTNQFVVCNSKSHEVCRNSLEFKFTSGGQDGYYEDARVPFKLLHPI